MTRALGIDLGDVRVGVAATDDGGRLALPVCTLDKERKLSDRLRRIARLGQQRDVSVYVVGLPLQMDGSEGEAAAKAREFGTRLAERTGKRVEYIDERLTTVAAHKALSAAEVRAEERKRRVDQVSAVLILESWLDRQSHDA